MDQVRAMNPPPNPAKLTGARSRAYIEEHGPQSWELDAIEPRQLVQLIRDEVEMFIDRTRWSNVEEQEQEDRTAIMKVAGNLRNS
jgi:hypothetical protein